MAYNQSASAITLETLVAAQEQQKAEMVTTRSHALLVAFGGLLTALASLGELGNVFGYWARYFEDRFGDLSVTDFMLALGISVSSFTALAYATHAGLDWMRGQDRNPPVVSVTIGLLSLALSIAFPLFQAGGVDDSLIIRCLFSLLLTIVAGIGVHLVVSGFEHKARHQAAISELASIEKSTDLFLEAKGRENSRGRRLKNLKETFQESFANAFVHVNNRALDSLTLAADSEGLPVTPIEVQVERLANGRRINPEVTELIELSAGSTAIDLQRRFSGRAMTTAEAVAVRRFLQVAQRPNPADVLNALKAQEI